MGPRDGGMFFGGAGLPPTSVEGKPRRGRQAEQGDALARTTPAGKRIATLRTWRASRPQGLSGDLRGCVVRPAFLDQRDGEHGQLFELEVERRALIG